MTWPISSDWSIEFRDISTKCSDSMIGFSSNVSSKFSDVSICFSIDISDISENFSDLSLLDKDEVRCLLFLLFFDFLFPLSFFSIADICDEFLSLEVLKTSKLTGFGQFEKGY